MSLAPGEKRQVKITLPADAFRYYDPGLHRWVLEPGKFVIAAGASSGQLREKASLTVG